MCEFQTEQLATAHNEYIKRFCLLCIIQKHLSGLSWLTLNRILLQVTKKGPLILLMHFNIKMEWNHWLHVEMWKTIQDKYVTLRLHIHFTLVCQLDFWTGHSWIKGMWSEKIVCVFSKSVSCNATFFGKIYVTRY